MTKIEYEFRMEVRFRYDWAIILLIGTLAGVLITVTIGFKLCTKRIVRSHTVT